MAPSDSFSSSPGSSSDGSPSARRFRDWQSAYDAVLAETDTAALFKLVEIAESSIRIRRAELAGSLDHHAERQPMEDALANLQVVKRERLKFG